MQIEYVDTILKRTSIRSYKSGDMGRELTEEVNSMISEPLEGPLGTKIRIKLIYKYSETNKKLKLGTYGFISGASYFLAGQVYPGREAFLDYGYVLEKLILELTARGLGTCWLGGTFDRGEFARAVELEEGKIIPAITPLGFPTDSRSLGDRLIRLGAGSRNRKGWESLFFREEPGKALEAQTLREPLKNAFELLRLAPSASNLQPWRIIARNNVFDFHLQRKAGYAGRFGTADLQMIDIGIGMSHFDLSLKGNGSGPEWKITEAPETIDGWEYVISAIV